MDHGSYTVSMSLLIASLIEGIDIKNFKLSINNKKHMIEDVDVESSIELSFDNKFKSKLTASFLNDIGNQTIINGKNGVEVVIGYSSTNTNRVNIPVETTTSDVTDPITFNANLFKEVLVANRECTSAVLEVSTEGLARVNFKVDDYDSTYYVVAMQDVD